MQVARITTLKTEIESLFNRQHEAARTLLAVTAELGKANFAGRAADFVQEVRAFLPAAGRGIPHAALGCARG